MNRRQFIKVTAAATGGLSSGVLGRVAMSAETSGGGGDSTASEPTPRAQGDGTARPRGPIRKAVKFGMVQGDASVVDKFRSLRDLGYDGVEIDGPSSISNDEWIAARDASGLPIHGVVNSVHWQMPLSAEDPATRDAGREALELALRISKAVGGDTVLLVPAIVGADVPYDVAYRRSQAQIRRVLPLAEELEIRIAIENVWNQFLLSPLEAARYVDEFSSPWIGWYMDVGNIVNYGYPEQWIRILGHRIFKVDIKGYSRKKRDQEGLWKGFQCEIGDDDCGWPRVVEALDEIGYEGWATAEVSGGDRARLADILARMKHVLVR